MAPPYSVQLFSVRDDLAADLPGTLARLAAMGWREVEPFGFGDDAAEYTAALERAGLRAPSTHTALTGVDLDELFGWAGRAGIGTLFDPWSDPVRWESREGVASLAAEFGEIAARAADHGIRVGYHNHDVELRNTIDGRPALELFAELADPRVALQLDCYWAQAAGVDPVPLLGQLGDRVTALHLKDGDGRVDEHSQAGLGAGAQPLADILAAAPDALRVVELDDVSDAADGDTADGDTADGDTADGDTDGGVWAALERSLRWLEEHDA